jgi:hypothetical protein
MIRKKTIFAHVVARVKIYAHKYAKEEKEGKKEKEESAAILVLIQLA